jgi:O-antigen ligase
MRKKNYTPLSKANNGLSILFGITFLSPLTYSVIAYEMDVIQRMVFFCLSLILFLVFIIRLKTDDLIPLNWYLSVLFVLFPFTFLTAFMNGSESLLILKYSDIIVPLSILLQSALLFFILGEERFFKTASFAIVIFSTLFSLIGILEVFKIKTLTLPTVVAPGSLLGHRSFAAEYLLPAIPFFMIAKDYLNKENKYLLSLAAIVNVSFLLFTRSRAGLIILIISVLLYIIFILIKREKGKRLKTLIPVFAIIVCSFLISLIPVKVGERPDLTSTAESFFNEDFKSNMLRLNFWDASFKMIGEDPIVGKGLFKWSGYYPKYHGEYFNDKNLYYVHNIHAHNDFLEIFAESGLVSALIFALIYFTIILILFKKSLKNEKYFLLLLTFLITTWYSFVAFPNHKFASYFLAAVVSGTALVSSSESRIKSFTVKLVNIKWLLLVLIISGGVVSYIKLKSEINYGQAIYLKDRRQYPLMLQKLEEVSVMFYPLDTSKQPVDYYRGIAYSFLGRYQDALNNTLSAKQLAPFNPILWRNVAGAYQSMGKVSNAIDQYEKLWHQFPNYLNAQFNLLDLYIEAGLNEKAKILYLELVKKSPENPRLNEFNTRIETP